MPRIQPRSIPPGERMRILDEFWTMIALLETRDEVKRFFKDLLSESEAVMLARRIQIAKLLLSGMSYGDIQDRLKTSETTIASVHRWLQGGFGGYSQSLGRLRKELERRQELVEKHEEARTPYSGEWLKRKYPLHYLLMNFIDWASLRPPKKLRHEKKR